ncbi:MAG: low molecular weight protein-tyrosine-phosphatase [Candidatus Promineifilaceae bacterium]
MFNRVLAVCVGNVCRSPMAAALLADHLGEERGIVVHSAGLGALIGCPADEMAQALMRDRGIDLSRHRARQLTPAMVLDYDLILVKETSHIKAIEAMQPSAHGRVYRLGHWSDVEIPDPYQKSITEFENTLELIDRSLMDWRIKFWS